MANLNVTTNVNDINVQVTDNNINITPTDTQIRVFAGGYAQPGGNDTEIQYNDGGVLAGAANITYTNGNMVVSNNNLKISGGQNGYFLQTDGNGTLTWYPGTAFPTGNGTVGGANGQIQFNNAGNFGGLAGFTANVINNNISMPNNLSVGSNINVARITATGNITANYFIGNGSQLTGINTNPSNIANGNSNVTVTANSNVTISVAGNANVVTVTDNGIVLDANSSFTGANLISANIVSATGNITADYFIGNGSQLTGIDTSQISNGNSNVRVFANSDITFSVGGFANILKVDAANSTITTTYDINVGGGVTATQFYGSGQNLSNITGANVTGYVANANVANIAYSVSGANVSGIVANANYAAYAGNATIANSANSVDGANVTGQVANALVAGTVYTNAQPNITSVGTLSNLNVTSNINSGTITATGNVRGGNLYTLGNIGSGQNLTVGGNAIILEQIQGFGNVIGNSFIGNGSRLTSLTGANVTGTVPSATTANSATTAGTVTTASQPNITSVGTLTSLAVSGNTTSNNFIGNLNGFLYNGNSNVSIPIASGNIILTSNSVTGLTISSNVVKFGNGIAGNINNVNFITANYFVGNGATLTNITAGNVTGNFNNITATGNITANYFIGNGSQLTGINTGVQSSIANGTSSINIATTNGPIFISTFGSQNYSPITFTKGTYFFEGNANVYSWIGIGSTPSPGGALAVTTSGSSFSTIGFFKFFGNVSTQNVLRFERARGTETTPQSVIAGDNLGGIIAAGHNGTAYAANAVSIRALVDSSYTAGNTNIPIGWRFATSDGANTFFNFMYANGDFTPAGNIVTITNSNHNLGNSITANVAKANVYMQTGVFADTTARDTAIPTPAAGMIVLVSNIGGSAKFQGFDGSVWANLS